MIVIQLGRLLTSDSEVLTNRTARTAMIRGVPGAWLFLFLLLIVIRSIKVVFECFKDRIRAVSFVHLVHLHTIKIALHFLVLTHFDFGERARV